jgi:hypothetical protein
MSEQDSTNSEGNDESRRSSVVDRRSGLDRRLMQDGSRTGLEQRRGPGRRRSDFTRQAEEGEMSPEQFLFIMAIDAFKRVNGKSFPTWTEVLSVIRRLGYRKTMPSELNLPNTEDWREAPDTPAMVAKPVQADEDED